MKEKQFILNKNTVFKKKIFKRDFTKKKENQRQFIPMSITPIHCLNLFVY